MAQASHVTGIRRARYTGLPKTRLEHLAAATAINVIRLDAWYAGNPIDRTRTTHLQRVNLAPVALHRIKQQGLDVGKTGLRPH